MRGSFHRAPGADQRRLPPRLTALGVALGAFAFTSPASALTRLEWTTPANSNCASKAELTALVESSAGRTLFTDEGASLILRGEVTPAPEVGFRARLELERASGDPVGSRDLSVEGESCRSLDESLALVVSLMLDAPDVRQEAHAPALPPSPQASEPPAGPPPPEPLPPPRSSESFAPESRPSHHAILLPRVSVYGAWGATPGIAPGLRLGAIFTPTEGLVPALVDLSSSLPTSSELDGGGTFAASSHSLGVLACPLFGQSPYHLQTRGCLGLRGGMLAASTDGFDENGQTLRAFVEPVASLELVGPLRAPLWAFVRGEIGAPLVRDRFHVVEADSSRTELYRRPIVTFSVEVGVEVRSK